MRYTRGTGYFVNPYNFIPLGQHCLKEIDYSALKKEKGLMTGWIECELKTRSPLFVPNSSNNDRWKKKAGTDTVKSYDFASLEDLSHDSDANVSNTPAPVHPIIPGSELRGVIRSAYEAVTNSCMSAIDDDKVLYKRTTTPGKPALYIEDKRRHKIFKCEERIGVAAWSKYHKTSSQDSEDFSEKLKKGADGQAVWFSKSSDKYQSSRGFGCFYYAESLSFSEVNGLEKGYLHIGEWFQRKHHESIFVLPASPKSTPIDERAGNNLKRNFELYADETVNQSIKNGHRRYKSVDRKEVKPVYYKEINGRYYLSPAAIGREVFYNRIYNLINDYVPCESSKKLCPACALFGFVSDKGKDAVSGRVRFSDANLTPDFDGKDNFFSPRVIPELASPKPSATEFYLKKPQEEADLWNYDYAGSWPRRNGELTNGEFNPIPIKKYKPEIRGRKFFWHSNLDASNAPDAGKTISKRNVMIRPMKSGVCFSFKVFFNDITEVELKKLLWVLSIPDSSNPQIEHGHKLGMGKPLGMGSVSIKIKDVVERQVSLEAGYVLKSRKELLDSLTEVFNLSDDAVKAFLRITQLRPAFQNGAKVVYPCLDSPDSRVYEWFVGNKQICGKGTQHVIDQTLPLLLDKKLELKKYVN